MQAIELRKKVISTCLDLLNQHIKDTTEVIRDIEQSVQEYGPPKDRYDSFKTQLSRRRELLSEQIQKAWEEIEIFKKIDPEKIETEAGFGAMVITTKQQLFISVGMGKFEIDGKVWHAVSPSVPISQALAGLKKGESFVFRDEKITILEVF
jgi:transcription elongation GreA/GreB family factor